MVRWSEEELTAFQARRKTPRRKQPRIRGAQRVEVGRFVFQSKREAKRWQELELLQHAGEISNLRRQVPFAIVINRMHVCDYLADFVYLRDGVEVVEDVKGFATEVFRLKAKLVRALYGIEILVTK